MKYGHTRIESQYDQLQNRSKSVEQIIGDTRVNLQENLERTTNMMHAGEQPKRWQMLDRVEIPQ